MLSLAKLRCHSTADLIGIGKAADLLNVSRPTIYRWMDDGTLDYVRDDLSDRIFLIRRSVLDAKERLEEQERLKARQETDSRSAALAAPVQLRV
jgi:excisionase family DNA binding protein